MFRPSIIRLCVLTALVAPLPALAATLQEQADSLDKACVAGMTDHEQALRQASAAAKATLPGSPARQALGKQVDEYRAYATKCQHDLDGLYRQLAKQSNAQRIGLYYKHLYDFGPGARDRADDWQEIVDARG